MKISKQVAPRLGDLVAALREQLGHLVADLDPLGGSPREHPLLLARLPGITNRHALRRFGDHALGVGHHDHRHAGFLPIDVVTGYYSARLVYPFPAIAPMMP